MKKSLIALALLVSVCCLSSCSNGDVSTSSDADKSSSMASSAQSSKTDKKSDKKTSSNLEDELFEGEIFDMEDDIDSIYHTPTSDYPLWTFEDWISASEDQRKQCLDFFSLEVGRDVDESNLSKIFATNQDKTLTEIIDIQKAKGTTASGDDFVQPDPGHGAAAGQDID